MKRKTKGATAETAAKRVIKAFGNANRLANELGITRGAVCRWDYPKARRGSEGRIPSEWHKPILAAAERLGIELSPGDLVNI